MSVVLYHNDLSAPSRAVLMTAGALDAPLDLHEVPLYGRERRPELVKVNPHHTVPTMVDGDLVIWESHAIAGYLVGLGGDNELYPKETKARATVDQFLYFDSGVLYPRVSTIINSIVVENEKEISTKKISAITESYKFLDAFLQTKPYLTGPTLTVADLCCVATVSTATIITPISTEKYPHLSTWYRTCKNLPYYEETNGVGLNKLDALVELKLGRPRTKDLL